MQRIYYNNMFKRIGRLDLNVTVLSSNSLKETYNIKSYSAFNRNCGISMLASYIARPNVAK